MKMLSISVAESLWTRVGLSIIIIIIIINSPSSQYNITSKYVTNTIFTLIISGWGIYVI